MCAFFHVIKGLSKNHVVNYKGINSTRFPALAETLFSSESSWTQNTEPKDSKAAVWVVLFVWQTRHWLILFVSMVKSLVVLISACVCRRPSWTPKTQPNGSSAVVWLSFWCSTRFTRKKCLTQHGDSCRLHSYIFGYVIFGQSQTHDHHHAAWLTSVRWDTF